MTKATGEGLRPNNKDNSKVSFFGAGTRAMLICLILILGWQMLHQAKVRIERKVETSGERLVARLPSVSHLLNWKTSISLTEQQLQKLSNLREQQEKELIPIEAQTAEIMSPVQQSAESSLKKPMGASEFQTIARQLSIPSKRKRQIERQFSESAWTLLTEEQKQDALGLWRKSRNSKAEHKEAGKN